MLKSLKFKITFGLLSFLLFWFFYLGPAADNRLTVLEHFEKIPSDIEVVDYYPVLIFKIKSLPKLIQEGQFDEITSFQTPITKGMYNEILTEVKLNPQDSHRLYMRNNLREKTVQLLIYDDATKLIYSQVWATEQ